ncbi:hypothetical protein F53441_1959 [Fusarium austroafricanum]|uniref:Uncharacterized protein n=1 Tax=Fusarium austroafricanum TaxID=2364996 RepID=A0A8H4P1L7_9HYPO|nr:hypothetical protein F53441_1959 [Fusarium austroafricanum]
MSLLRDVIGSAIESSADSSQRNRNFSRSRQTHQLRRNASPYDTPASSSRSEQAYSRNSFNEKSRYKSYEQGVYSDQENLDTKHQAGYRYDDEPPAYSLHAHDAYTNGRPRSEEIRPRSDFYEQSAYSPPSFPSSSMIAGPAYSQPSLQSSGFRPLALPQVQFGDGEPFLRGYSSELSRYGISRDQFLQVVDAINVARTPNPEVQLFQQGANIAGWFIPGVGGIAMMAGQVGVGVASHFGHASIVSKALTKANTEVFAPNGLEICIGKTKDLNMELGVSGYELRDMPCDTSPIDRINSYGHRIAYVDEILPDRSDMGRRDPLAVAGRALSKRNNQRKAQRTQERQDKGKQSLFRSSANKVEWLIVKLAPNVQAGQW